MFSSSTSNKSIFLSHSFPLSLSHTFLSLSRLPLSGLLSNIRILSSFLTPFYTISFSELTHLPLSLYLSPFLLPLLSFSRSLSLPLSSTPSSFVSHKRKSSTARHLSQGLQLSNYFNHRPPPCHT